jgi:hypothetical protein
VAALVSRATQGRMPVFAAALLHDAVEDQGIGRQAIAAMFVGSRWVVLEVTDDKRGHGGAQALQVDQASLKWPTRSAPSDWPVERQLDYV